MTIQTATKQVPGVKIYYVNSDSGASYVVVHVRRARMSRWTCSCPDFIHRRQTKGSYRFCKHVRGVVNEIHAARHQEAA